MSTFKYNSSNRNVDDIFEINKSVLGLSNMNDNPRRLFFSKKETTDLESVKKLFRYYEYLGFQQVNEKWEKLTKLYELAYGKINNREFQVAKETYNTILSKLSGEQVDNEPEVQEVDLKFFPLIPPVVNSIINDMDKKITRMYVKAINPEATNSIIEDRNKELRALLVEQAMRLFEVELEGLDEEQRKAKLELFEKSAKIQEYYQKDHRLEVETWANHHLNLEEQKYNIKDLEKQILEKTLVTDSPFIRVEFNGTDYKYSPVDERNAFFLKSPLDDDASQYMMFGTFTYSTIDSIIGKYKLTPEHAEKLEDWSTMLSGQMFPKNRVADPNNDYLELVTENLRYHKQLHHDSQSRIGQGLDHLNNMDETSEIPPNLVRETVINFKLPRKKGELTYLVNGVKYTEIVDESYKVYIKPDYDLTWTKEKTAQNLVNGEHIEWFYESESWTGVKLDIASRNVSTIQNDFDTIWLSLERDKIQIKDPFRRFSTILPVHGGKSSQMTETLSLVERGSVWQAMYNFLGNRCQNLLATEIGLFYIMNQGVIPHESFDGSWGENNLQKWGQLAHDFGITVTSTDINQISGQSMLAGAGYGQVVDLTKTNDVIAKLNLMSGVKREFYSTLGISPEQLAEISPNQSGKSVAQGLQRTSNMLHHYYKRTKDIMKRARQTGLYYAKYLQENSPKDLNYTTNEGSRITFRTLGKDFSLADLAIYLHNDLDDIDKLNDLYSLVMNDNTMGADSLEKASMLFSKTSTEVLDKLKELKVERDVKLQEERQFQQQQQQQLIESQKQMLVEEQERQDRRLAAKMQSDREIAEIKAYGYANSTVDEIHDVIQSVKDQEESERNYDLKLRELLRKEKLDEQKLELQKDNIKQTIYSKESLEAMRLAQRNKEIEAQNERTKAMILASKNKK